MRFNWKVTVFSLVCLALFFRLGLWQLDREKEKIAMLAASQARQQAAPVSLASLDMANRQDLQGVAVTATGFYLAEQIFLLDNRVLNGKVGFEVLVPFSDQQSGMTFLVNRGFVPMGINREVAAEIPELETDAPATGYIDIADEPNNDVRENPAGYAAPGAGHVIVQMADPGLIQAVSGIMLAPFVVRLKESDQNALPRYWPVTVMQPEKHRGYAVQWFMMACAVVIAWTAFSFPSLFTRSDQKHGN
ncbi:MAG: SURF1 family protein [Pseudomonadota bacterium]